ncbi:MarR family transcriptional regulator [Allokutzneria sp. A3M-2-11 16]|uniref:MarR family transcriptional regulator n=1 Tax=Allokutzneria sp. A3M-2-11 16 TaxID=2962043 RepID=UPI0020B81F77|nr:MarR family transcriptional regulator [Allokutzneria sp. A3M-2-11 16]MCP3801727.1 MarR family transcriptional regulator [Allokutzneria sp. A3M-2-11 16]
MNAAERDSVDEVLADWARERPDLDFSPIAVIFRMGRVRARLETAMAEVFAGFDLSPADFLVIVTLRRAGAPYRLPQARLMAALGLTSGTVSVRLARLEERGVVRRESDPGDKRTQMVRLTEDGVALFDQLAPAHLAGEDRLLAALDAGERDQLAHLLRKLLVSFERTGTEAPWLWGMRLEPAHIAHRRRAQVGLSCPPGLLIAETRHDGPAAAAGLLRGDLVTEADGRPVRHIDHLRAADAERLPLRLLRGETPVEATLTIPRRTT